MCLAQQTLYGGDQWLQFESVNSGWLVTVNPDDASVTKIGKPAGVERLSGLAFDASGTLWATSITGTPSGTLRTSTLFKLDPRDGSLIETIGPVLDGPGGNPGHRESVGAIQTLDPHPVPERGPLRRHRPLGEADGRIRRRLGHRPDR